MTLLEVFSKIDRADFNYYNDWLPNPFDGNGINESAKVFIKEYFKRGGKDTVLCDLRFGDLINEKGKHLHTVTSYFLGLHLGTMASGAIENFLKKYLLDFKGFDEVYKFQYVWFLSSLYHDTASVIERNKNSYHKRPLEFFLGEHDVLYDVYQCEELKSKQVFTFPENLVKNYFYYRIDNSCAVEHGILGGYILFDRLRKNYEEAWRMCSKNPNSTKNNSRKKFESNGYSWELPDFGLYAIVADSIIAHNIWFAKKEDKELYESYGLSPLIPTEPKKIDIKKNPLLFLLALVDTIEPVKRFFEGNDFDDEDIQRVLENISINHEPKQNSLVISVEKDFLSCFYVKKIINQWFDGIKKAERWLNISVCSVGDNFGWLNEEIEGGYDKSKNKPTIKIIIE